MTRDCIDGLFLSGMKRARLSMSSIKYVAEVAVYDPESFGLVDNKKAGRRDPASQSNIQSLVN